MKLSHIKSCLLAITLTLALFNTNEAVSENTTLSQTNSTSHPVSVEANHPLAMAHQKLEQAYDDYKEGNIDAVQNDLNAASKWLQDPEIGNNTITRDEAAKLADEIQSLQQKIKHPSDKHEAALTRIWHRTSALVRYEIQQMERSWSENSTANKTLKHLLGAKLHLNYAEHELFDSHETEKANRDLNKAITYLDDAYNIATPGVREKIASIKKDMQMLANSHISTSEQQEVFDALDTASASLKDISQSVAPLIQARLKIITTEIENLKGRIGILERQQQYDTILKRIRKLTREL